MSKSFLDVALERRDAVKAEMDAILEAVASETRTDLTTEETEKVDSLVEESRALDAKIEKFATQAAADAKAAEFRASVAAIVVPKIGGTSVTSEPRTYTARSETSFVKDAYNAQFKGDFTAQERLARHMKEDAIERRDVGTGAFEGLVVPQYLTDLAAPLARAGRPFLDAATTKYDLPAAGMTLNISRQTTGTATAIQASENAAVQETDSDDTLLTVNVRTIAGAQDISRQAIERGTGIDTFIVRDLIRAWHTNLNSQCLNGAGTSGTILGLDGSGGTVVTFTTASPTAALLYPKLADAVQQVQTATFMSPTHWVMHPRRLAFLLAATDTAGRPLVVPVPNGAFNAMGVGAGASAYGNSGYTLLGLPVVTDASVVTNAGVGTNQDKIYCVAAPEMHLWEQPGSPFALNFAETNAANLTIKTVVYGYAAFSAGRYPGAAAIINGTGLVTPAF